MHPLRKKLVRFFIRRSRYVMPIERARRLEHDFRGREEHRRLRLADYVVVSHPKSGRTWLRTLISRYYQLRYELPESAFLNFDNLHRSDERVPRVFFTHDTYVRMFTGNLDSKRDYFDKKVLILLRRPQDVAASKFFQWKYRTRTRKAILNDLPDQRQDLSIFDFVMNEKIGLPAIIDWMNSWQNALPHLEDHCVIRYEDLKSQSEETLGRVMSFLGEEVRPDWIADSIEFGSVDNMRSMETKNFFWSSGSRLAPRDKANPHSYKVRRAKVGGYRDYFDDEQLAIIDGMVRDRLDPALGYGVEPAPATQTEQTLQSSGDPSAATAQA